MLRAALAALVCLIAAPVFAQGTFPPAEICPGGSVEVAFGATRTITGNETETCLRVEGTLVITSTGHLTVDTIDVAETGVLDFEPGFEVTINDATINLTDDSEQWGHGIVVRGTASMQGTPLSCTWLGITEELSVGETVVDLTGNPATCGWQNGDRIVIPDTRQLAGAAQDTQFCSVDCPNVFFPEREFSTALGRWEVRTISSMSGTTLTLSSGLTYDHECARNAAETQCDFYPHMMNMTRDSVIRSESATGTRGHIICVDDASCDIQYVQLNDLGRTKNKATACCDLDDNVIGRYPIHAHHMTTAPTFVGNAIDGGDDPHRHRWALAIHNTDGGTISYNTIYNYAGAGIMLEDGNENDNTFAYNMIVRSAGDGVSSRADQSPGNEGSGFWARSGTDNAFVGNIVANTALYGYTFFAGGPFEQFEANVSYAGRRGFTMWEINGASTGSPNMDAPHSTLLNFLSWHDFDGAMPLHYPAFNIIFDGLTVRCDASQKAGVGFTSGDYQTLDFIVRNANIQGCRTGLHTSMKVVDRDSTFTVEDSYFYNYFNIEVHSMAGPGGGGGSSMKNQTVILRNNDVADLLPSGGITYSDDTPIAPSPLRMYYQTNGNYVGHPAESYPGGQNGNLQVTHNVYLYDHNGNASADYRLYWAQQAASYVMPQTGSIDGIIACPSSGLTNAQCWSMHGVASFGSLPTCEDAHADVLNGFACSITQASTRKPRRLGPLRRTR